jgi:1,4-alpha-glucan branching enzyme
MNTDVQAFNEFSIGVPERAFYKEIINSDDTKYAGSGVVNKRQVRAKKQPMHGMPYSITIRVPAVGGCILKMKRKI